MTGSSRFLRLEFSRHELRLEFAESETFFSLLKFENEGSRDDEVFSGCTFCWFETYTCVSQVGISLKLRTYWPSLVSSIFLIRSVDDWSCASRYEIRSVNSRNALLPSCVSLYSSAS